MIDPVQQAGVLVGAGRLAEAIQLYREALRIDPRRFDALYSMGQVLLRAGQVPGAADAFERALTIDPAYAEGWLSLGVASHRMGKRDRALACFDRAIALRPDFVDAHCNRAAALLDTGKLDEALAGFDRALHIAPNHAASWNNRGNALAALDRPEEAVDSFDRALALDPSNVAAWCNRGNALGALKRWHEVVESFDRALALKPDFADAVVNRAGALLEMGRAQEALAECDRALALAPNSAYAQRSRLEALAEIYRGTPAFAGIACELGQDAMQRECWHEALTRFDEALTADPRHADALTGRKAAALEVNRGHFDEYASVFDNHLRNALEYRGPEQLRALAERVIPPVPAPMRILDLGCGTGLSGAAFKDWAQGGALDGIDISSRMLERARERGLYTNLVEGDLEEVLSRPGTAYDLVVSADTLTYFGALEAVFSGVFARLTLGGFFVFGVEKKDGDGWDRPIVDRHRHSELYLQDVAARAGFVFVDSMEATLRREGPLPVPGLTMALRRPD